MAHVGIIGSGFAGLSSACFMSRAGHEVTLCEKNDSLGGRARTYESDGFMFDMGPSWYWMPDVFERFFANFGKKTSDFYELVQLDPGFQMIFGKDDVMEVPASVDKLRETFESIEPGSAKKLDRFLAQAKLKYDIGMGKMVYKPSHSWLEYMTFEVMTQAPRLQMFSSVRAHVRSYFKNERLVALMEFPVLFLGAMAHQIPAMYSMMNYSALVQGTWYPMGGMAQIVKGMQQVAEEQGVHIKTNCPVEKLRIDGGHVKAMQTKHEEILVDGVIATGDYHHIESCLLDSRHRNYSDVYWADRTLAPSCLIFYLGVNKKVDKLLHHNLFFDASLDKHSSEIYEHPQWPSDPLFYVCCPSKTDPSVAPIGMENLFVLVPIATGLEDNGELRDKYYEKVMKRIEDYCGHSIADSLVHKRSYCVNDFTRDYHALRGNAYGLANTLRQTGAWKPSLRNKQINNLFYAGQLTVPGPGVPPALISGQIAATELMKTLKQQMNEAIV